MKVFLITMMICLFLQGCSGESGGEGQSPAAESLPEEEMLSEEKILPHEMELLQSDDPENENLADMLQKNGGGMMVQIGAGSRLGSGVLYDAEEGQLLILTAAHVLEEAEASLRITFADGFSMVCDDFSCPGMGDIGLIRVNASEIPGESLELCLLANVDKESFDGVEPGDGCIVMGSRTGVAAEAYEGTVLEPWIYMEDYGQYMMWVKAEGKPGMSGGGLFDRQGHFLGILSGGNEDGELAVVPLSIILAALESEG